MEDAGIATYPKTAETREYSESTSDGASQSLELDSRPLGAISVCAREQEPAERKRADMVSMSLAHLMPVTLYHTAVRASVGVKRHT